MILSVTPSLPTSRPSPVFPPLPATSTSMSTPRLVRSMDSSRLVSLNNERSNCMYDFGGGLFNIK